MTEGTVTKCIVLTELTNVTAAAGAPRKNAKYAGQRLKPHTTAAYAIAGRVLRREKGAEMTVRDYFEQVREIERQIKIKQEQIIHLKEIATRATSVIEAVRIGGTANRSKMADAVDSMVDLERELERDIIRLKRLYEEVSGVIVKVENENCRELLTRRYLCNENWEVIAEKMNFDPRSVYRIHKKALAEAESFVPVGCA